MNAPVISQNDMSNRITGGCIRAGNASVNVGGISLIDG